jgi:hypothetical protein
MMRHEPANGKSPSQDNQQAPRQTDDAATIDTLPIRRKSSRLFANTPDAIDRRKDLTPTAKRLYGKINALCRMHRGVCTASNRFLADSLDVCLNSLETALALLIKKELVHRTMNGRTRKSLTIIDPDAALQVQKAALSPPQKLGYPHTPKIGVPPIPQKLGTDEKRESLQGLSLSSSRDAKESSDSPSARREAAPGLPSEQEEKTGGPVAALPQEDSPPKPAVHAPSPDVTAAPRSKAKSSGGRDIPPGREVPLPPPGPVVRQAESVSIFQRYVPDFKVRDVEDETKKRPDLDREKRQAQNQATLDAVAAKARDPGAIISPQAAIIAARIAAQGGVA